MKVRIWEGFAIDFGKDLPVSQAHAENVGILKFGASSIDFELIFDVATTDQNRVAGDRTAVALALLRAFSDHSLEFAYPTQVTFTAAPDGSMIMPYPAR